MLDSLVPRPSPTLLLQATNAGARRPGYEASCWIHTAVDKLNDRVWIKLCQKFVYFRVNSSSYSNHYTAVTCHSTSRSQLPLSSTHIRNHLLIITVTIPCPWKRLQQLFCLIPSPREFYFPWHETMPNLPCYFEIFIYLHSIKLKKW